jgi:hypothetical protein
MTPHLTIRDHVDPGQLLGVDRLVDGPILHSLEFRIVELALLVPATCVCQVGRAQQAADDLGLRHG